MSRLIDADAILPMMEARMDMQDLYLPIHFQEMVIDEMPTVDAVEVVRCGECRHYDHYSGSSIGSGVCSREKRKMNPIVDCDWFCADGERGEEK